MNKLLDDKDKKYIKNEIKLHIKRNYSKFLWLAILFIALTTLLIPITSLFSTYYYESLKTLNSAKYEYVITSKYDKQINDTYFQLDNIIGLESDDGISNSIAYIQLNTNYNNFVINKKLALNEIMISKKIAKNLKIDVGDYVNLSLNIWDSAQSYKVVEIYNNIPSFYDCFDKTNTPMVIVGYNESIVENLKGNYVSLLTEEEKIEFFNSELSYSKFYSKANEVKSLRGKMFLIELMPNIVHLVLLVLYVFATNRVINAEVYKYFRSGFSICYIKRIKLIDILSFLIFVVLINSLILSMFFINKILLFVPHLIINLLAIIVQLIISLGEKRYELCVKVRKS